MTVTIVRISKYGSEMQVQSGGSVQTARMNAQRMAINESRNTNTSVAAYEVREGDNSVAFFSVD